MPESVDIVELLPHHGRLVDADVDIAAEAREPRADRPWVFTNMIASLDGATTIEGRSGLLGRPSDSTVFSALRALADVVVVGATTVIDEDYRPPGDRLAELRIARGQRPRPQLAILSRSLSIEATHRVFSDPGNRPLVITITDAPPDRRSALAEVADLVDAGQADLDLDRALRALGALGHRLALLEGGPTINGQFVAVDAIDEWNLSLSPLLAGGDGPRTAHGPTPEHPTAFDLVRLWRGDGLLFGRWVRARR